MVKACALVWNIEARYKTLMVEDLEWILENARDRICERDGIAIAGTVFHMDEKHTHDLFLKCTSPRYPYNWALVKSFEDDISQFDYVISIGCKHTRDSARTVNIPCLYVELGRFRKVHGRKTFIAKVNGESI